MFRAAVLVLLASSAVAAPVPKELKAKGSNLDGKWEVVELWSGLSDVASLNPWVWEISGERLTIYDRQKDGTLQLNDPRTATTLERPPSGGADDIDYIRGDGKLAVFKGTAVVEGDELIICFNGPDLPRPTERKPFQSGWYYRFKRVKEK